MLPETERGVLQQYQTRFEIRTHGQGLTEFTHMVEGWLEECAISNGVLTVFCAHTSASLTIQENADPDVQHDLQIFFKRLVAEDPGLYRHICEGPDDMPAHIRAALTNVSLSIPVQNGRAVLGTWQGIYLFEHRNAPHRRQIHLHVIGQ
tara:strand:+ start:3845 stop:4291 length:447 start_codon:yes stop_codon:yes gene_type:complete